jgi:superfamily II DNA/RNA helicase
MDNDNDHKNYENNYYDKNENNETKTYNNNKNNISSIQDRLKNKKKQKGFYAFNLEQNLIQAIKYIGYRFPTPIQRRTIPEAMSGFNLIAHSRTGKFVVI